MVNLIKLWKSLKPIVGPSRWEWWCLPWRASPPRCPPSAQRWTPSRRPTSILIIRYKTSLVIWVTFFSLLAFLWIRKHPWENLRQSFLNFFAFDSVHTHSIVVAYIQSLLTTAHNLALRFNFFFIFCHNICMNILWVYWKFEAWTFPGFSASIIS